MPVTYTFLPVLCGMWTSAPAKPPMGLLCIETHSKKQNAWRYGKEKLFLQTNCHVSQLTLQYLNPAWVVSPQYGSCHDQVQGSQEDPHLHDLVENFGHSIAIGLIVGLFPGCICLTPF